MMRKLLMLPSVLLPVLAIHGPKMAFAGPLLPAKPAQVETAKLMSISTAPAETTFSARNDETAAFLELSADLGFLGAETKLKQELEEARLTESAALILVHTKSLGWFYFAHDLHVEVLATFEALKEFDLEAKYLLAKSHFAMGQYRDVIALFDGEAEIAPIAAEALVKMGAFEAAWKHFATADVNADNASYFLNKATAAIALGFDPQDWLNKATNFSLSEVEQGQLQYLITVARGDDLPVLHRIAREEREPWSSLAALDLIVRDAATAKSSPAATIAALNDLYLRSDDAFFRRSYFMARASALELNGDIKAEVASLNSVIEQFHVADDAKLARHRLQNILENLFERADKLTPIDAAQLFFENISYAPPGEKGDVLIRNVVERLVNLDLTENAAELLDHQVFHRLRGFERSIVAADLAAIYLTAKNPEDALRVLRSTRIAGLEDTVNNKRRLMEAKALVASGKNEAALNLLESAATYDQHLLKAKIYWQQENWIAAASAYHDLISAAPESAKPEALIRASIAYAKNEDWEALEVLLQESHDDFSSSAELKMARALLQGKNSQSFSDDIADFMNNYREKFRS